MLKGRNIDRVGGAAGREGGAEFLKTLTTKLFICRELAGSFKEQTFLELKREKYALNGSTGLEIFLVLVQSITAFSGV